MSFLYLFSGLKILEIAYKLEDCSLGESFIPFYTSAASTNNIIKYY
jgi:hypothetical protein